MNVPRLEKEIGIEAYATKSVGISGKLRQFPEDFRVEEILTDGSIAKIEPNNIPVITGHGRYLICILVKRKMDTFQAIQAVADKLNISTERIQIGGIKDANAVTAQHISISRILSEQATQIKTDRLWLYPLQLSNEKMHSALLAGNRFNINIRDIHHSTSTLKKRLEQTTREIHELNGCANFFGHQRFGTSRPITHIVGKHILHGEWEKAALMFLAKANPHEHPESRQARQRLWETRNYEDALHYFPHKLIYERQMLMHLNRQRRDFPGAFHRLPLKLRQLFIQAYQSYLFNRFLSQRIKHELPLKKAEKNEYKTALRGTEYAALPLIGFKQGTSEGLQGDIERTILEEETVTPDKFKIPTMPRISSPGGLRTALMPITEFDMEKPVDDEANRGMKKVNLSFALRKGSYATIVLREFMKPKNTLISGF